MAKSNPFFQKRSSDLAPGMWSVEVREDTNAIICNGEAIGYFSEVSDAFKLVEIYNERLINDRIRARNS